MSNYLLLRNNLQSGPYSLDQLKNFNISTTDLIWVEGKSNGWTYAGEIDDLNELFETREKNMATPVAGFTSSYMGNDAFIKDPSSQRNHPSLENKYSRPLDEIKEMYVHHLKKTGKTKKYKLALIASVVAILLLSGFVVIKWIEKPEEVQVKVTRNATPAPGEPVTNSENFQNALSKEFIPYEARPKKTKPKDLKKMVSVEANEYHVRLLGGINDLQLTIQNYSEHLLNKVSIKVDYLKPNGEVVNTEVVTVKNIKPQETKNIDVPPSKRGVKIKYTILNVYSQEYKAIMEI